MPLFVPTRPWESISMDFVGGLPVSKKGNDYLYVVVDRFSKMCILIPCKKTITGQGAADLFFNHVWIHFGLPTSIISDRDSKFLGKFWTSLWERMDTRLKRSTAFHPQTDGQTEVVNRTVVHLLRGYCGKHSKTWDDHLSYIQHAYNRALHSSTNKSPFETCFGYLPKSPFDLAFASTSDEDLVLHNEEERAKNFIERIRLIHQKVKEQLEKSQAKYKERHDRHRVDHKFQVGDQVWLHLSKERQHGKGKKLKPLRYGPFKIIDQVGDNDFRLDLPPYMQIYSVVNVENLKLYEPALVAEDTGVILPSVEDLAPEHMNVLAEDAVLEKKKRSSRSGEHEVWRIGLKGQHPHKAKWYAFDRVRELYPHLIPPS